MIDVLVFLDFDRVCMFACVCVRVCVCTCVYVCVRAHEYAHVCGGPSSLNSVTVCHYTVSQLALTSNDVAMAITMSMAQ